MGRDGRSRERLQQTIRGRHAERHACCVDEQLVGQRDADRDEIPAAADSDPAHPAGMAASGSRDVGASGLSEAARSRSVPPPTTSDPLDGLRPPDQLGCAERS